VIGRQSNHGVAFKWCVFNKGWLVWNYQCTYVCVLLAFLECKVANQFSFIDVIRSFFEFRRLIKSLHTCIFNLSP